MAACTICSSTAVAQTRSGPANRGSIVALHSARSSLSMHAAGALRARCWHPYHAASSYTACTCDHGRDTASALSVCNGSVATALRGAYWMAVPPFFVNVRLWDLPQVDGDGSCDHPESH